MTTFKRFLKDESGATAIEYGLLAALISVVVIAGAQLLGSELNSLFDGLGKCIKDPTNGSGAVSADCKQS